MTRLTAAPIWLARLVAYLLYWLLSCLADPAEARGCSTNSGDVLPIFFFERSHATVKVDGPIFIELAHWADSIIESRNLSVCVCVCPLSMRFFSRPLIGPQIT